MPLRIPAGHLRVVLATLLLSAPTTVSTDVLIHRIWGEQPPGSARTMLQSLVSRLRRLLSTDGRTGDCALRTRGNGYVLDIDAGELDLRRFDELVRSAGQARHDGRMEDASADLRAALALWRGPVLADVESTVLHHVDVPRLEDRRLVTLEEWIDLELELGRHSALIPELQTLAEQHRFREPLRRQLMVALARAGRKAEALHVYRQTHRELAEELGIEPSEALRLLHQAILAGDSTLDWTPGAVVTPYQSRVVALTSRLPGDQPSFTGRDLEIGAVLRHVAEETRVRSFTSVHTLVGPPGIGKTALAVRIAHAALTQFPDGQIFMELRGGTDVPADPMEQSAQLLFELGVPRSDLPSSPAGRLAMYRRLVNGRRILVVLDDASDEAQIRPLLPDTPGSAVLITSRARLDGLLGSAHITLSPLGMPESVELLGRLIGTDRIEREPQAARQLAAYCEGFPLALRIVAARLVARPDWPVRLLADRMADAGQRLSHLRVGDVDLCQSVEATYRCCSAEQQRALRLLATRPNAPFSGESAAALLSRPAAVTNALLERLVDVHLLEPSGLDAELRPRYRMRELIWLYAHQRLLDEERVAATRPQVTA